MRDKLKKGIFELSRFRSLPGVVKTLVVLIGLFLAPLLKLIEEIERRRY